MVDVVALGWQEEALGELDHRKVTPPYVRLNRFTQGEHGDVVYFYDLRITQPNEVFLGSSVSHSIEHILLYGFQHYLPENFINVAPMGCQTGFYLVLLNEGSAQTVSQTYEKILQDIDTMTEVPYASEVTCGHAKNHDLLAAKRLAKKLLANKAGWHQIL